MKPEFGKMSPDLQIFRGSLDKCLAVGTLIIVEIISFLSAVSCGHEKDMAGKMCLLREQNRIFHNVGDSQCRNLKKLPWG